MCGMGLVNRNDFAVSANRDWTKYYVFERKKKKKKMFSTISFVLMRYDRRKSFVLYNQRINRDGLNSDLSDTGNQRSEMLYLLFCNFQKHLIVISDQWFRQFDEKLKCVFVFSHKISNFIITRLIKSRNKHFR